MTPHDPGRAQREKWERRWAERGEAPHEASGWVASRAVAHAGGCNVDLAGGDGRHARALAAAGHPALVVDFALPAVRRAVREPGVTGIVADARRLPFREGTLDLVLIVNFLERSLFSHVTRLLRPEGVVIVETYTTRHAGLVSSGSARGPASRAYMLEPGELPSLVPGLAIVEHWEGRVEEHGAVREIARLVARNTP